MAEYFRIFYHRPPSHPAVHDNRRLAPKLLLTCADNQSSHALIIMSMSSSTWALSHISRLLPLDQESLQQILDYSLTLPVDAAAEHLKNLLGDSPKALEFISAFNSRRNAPLPSHPDPNPIQSTSTPPRNSRKKKAPINKLPPPRQPENHGNTSGAYSKKEEEDYMSGSRRPRQSATVTNAFALSETPAARQLPTTASTTHSKPPPSASGPLISDLPNVRTSSRTASPAAKAKINVSGGAPMHGASTTLQDLVIQSFPTSVQHRLTFSVRIPQSEPLNFKPTPPFPPLLLPAAVHASQPATPFSPQPPTASIAAKSSA